MADRQAYPPPVKCSAKAKRTGEKCERWAVPGRLQCKLHGGLGGPHAGRLAAEDQAGATLTLAQMMANNPGRPVWEVILDSIRTVDVLAQAARDDVAAGKVTTAEGIERVAGLARSAHAMAASAVATKAIDMANQTAERWGDVVSECLYVLLTDWLGVPVGRNVSEAITATLRLDPSDQRPVPRPDGPPFLALVAQAQAAALAPRLGLAAGDLTAWLARVVDAVADGRPVPDLPGAPVAALPAAPAPEPPSHDSKVAGSGDEEPEPQVSEPAPPMAAQTVLATLAEAARSLTLHGQAPAEESEVVDAELIEPEPEAERQPSRIFDPVRRIYVRNPKYVRRASGSSGVTTLGHRGGQPTMPTSRLSY
ncbi:hypothetical protein AB0N38_32735 [Micromonospora aurantiaca]|uniref:hypothetical protein n=1 Tax=Micromonospora aurantiaca (nom. illeg.) TaxID=47850 RepID=UPI0034138032